jgi:hypothetical protein
VEGIMPSGRRSWKSWRVLGGELAQNEGYGRRGGFNHQRLHVAQRRRPLLRKISSAARTGCVACQQIRSVSIPHKP